MAINAKWALIAITLALGAKVVADVKPRDDQEAIEPEIRIIEGDSKTIHVHKINGQIYGIKVVPKKGAPYFLIDANGNGNFVRSESHSMLIPQWVLLEWK